MRCWWCGVEAEGLIDVTAAEQARPVRQIPIWPAGDHDHAEVPPTAEQLLLRSYDLLNLRIG